MGACRQCSQFWPLSTFSWGLSPQHLGPGFHAQTFLFFFAKPAAGAWVLLTVDVEITEDPFQRSRALVLAHLASRPATVDGEIPDLLMPKPSIP